MISDTGEFSIGASAMAEPWSISQWAVLEESAPAPVNGNRRRSRNYPAALAGELVSAIAQARNVEVAFELALRELCSMTGWALGQAWLRDGGPYLECSPAWCATSTEFQAFRDRSESLTFGEGEGLPGRAWAGKQPVWKRDLATNPELRRGPFARDAGLVAGLAVPVLAEQDVVAVLEFFMTEVREQDEGLIDIVSTIAAQLGALIRRKQAEDALRANEECFRLLIDSIEDCAIFRLDRGGRVTSWNPGAERITGYGADEIVGCNVARLYAGEAVHAGRPERHLELACADGRYEDADWRVRSDGLRFWASVVITALYDDSGELHGFSHVIRDATSQKLAEDELQRLRSVVDCSDDAIVSFNELGVITTWNPGAERLFGYSAREVVGRSVTVLVPDDALEHHHQSLEHALRQEHVSRYECCAARKNGGRVDVAVTVSPIRDPDGRLTGASAVARDITDHKCSQRRIERTLDTYLDADVADHILTEGPSPDATVIDATIMFLDVKNFTAVAERLDPREVVGVLNNLFGLAVPVINAHGGHVDKFIGDGLLAVFGAPCKLDAHADAALRAALEIDRLAGELLPDEVQIGIGLHSGEVVAGSVGGGGRLDFTVIGDPVNTAARIESATRTTGDCILFSAATNERLLGMEIPIVERSAVLLKGKSSPLPLYAPGVCEPRRSRASASEPEDHEAGREQDEGERHRSEGAVERPGELAT
jgi:PAS domain S-box-containing protein